MTPVSCCLFLNAVIFMLVSTRAEQPTMNIFLVELQKRSAFDTLQIKRKKLAIPSRLQTHNLLVKRCVFDLSAKIVGVKNRRLNG